MGEKEAEMVRAEGKDSDTLAEAEAAPAGTTTVTSAGSSATLTCTLTRLGAGPTAGLRRPPRERSGGGSRVRYQATVPRRAGARRARFGTAIAERPFETRAESATAVALPAPGGSRRCGSPGRRISHDTELEKPWNCSARLLAVCCVLYGMSLDADAAGDSPGRDSGVGEAEEVLGGDGPGDPEGEERVPVADPAAAAGLAQEGAGRRRADGDDLRAEELERRGRRRDRGVRCGGWAAEREWRRARFAGIAPLGPLGSGSR